MQWSPNPFGMRNLETFHHYKICCYIFKIKHNISLVELIMSNKKCMIWLRIQGCIVYKILSRTTNTSLHSNIYYNKVFLNYYSFVDHSSKPTANHTSVTQSPKYCVGQVQWKVFNVSPLIAPT